jgi:hypothetical protein
LKCKLKEIEDAADEVEELKTKLQEKDGDISALQRNHQLRYYEKLLESC